MIWRVVDPEDRAKCAALVASWGYFREVEKDEIEGSSWFVRRESRFHDPLGFVWFTEGPEDHSLSGHVCSDPFARGNLSTPSVMADVELFASLLGADRVYALLDASNPRQQTIKRWLRARGWQEHEYGMCREIGEEIIHG